jgi:hypothetical protein
MDNQHCWYKLNIDTSWALKEDWNIPKPSSLDIRVTKYPAEYLFNQDWLNSTAVKKLRIGAAMVFNRRAWQCDDEAHVDLLYPDMSKSATFSINWVIDSKDSEMLWFNKPDNTVGVEFTEADTPYMSWPINTLVEIDRCNIQLNAVMARVDVPHAVSVRSERRLCIAARSGLRMPWNLAVAYLRSMNMLVERD